MKFTILGASGFIGSNLVASLQQLGIECITPSRNDKSIFEQELGHVIYCIGLTADFRQKPFETVNAHVCYLLEILKKVKFESFLYLSSTRLYSTLDMGHEESSLKASPFELNDLYNLSKMMGESVCLAYNDSSVRVVRLSNVYGKDFSSDNFLTSIIRDAVDKNRVFLHTALNSEKDYISVEDVAYLLPKISISGKYRLYNIASGMNISNNALLQSIKKETGCIIEVKKDAKSIKFPIININRIKHEFGFSPIKLNDVIHKVIANYKQESNIK
jgi:nucleoside-diphosphate-sugar epimerase